MSWITPKTDWTNDDEFTYQDYNRIRNNLLYVNDMLNTLYPDKAEIIDLGEAKTGYTNDYYASEFNAFEEALESFTRVGMNMNIGEQMVFQGNTPFINYAELNRIENCSYRWYRIDPVVESATLTPSSFSLNNGATRQLTLTVVPSETSYTVEWESSDNSILTVNQSGLVTSVGTGSATITAKIIQHESVVLSCTSTGTVIIPVESISVSVNPISGYVGETKYVDVIVTPNNATNKDNWTIKNYTNLNCEFTKENGKLKILFMPRENERWKNVVYHDSKSNTAETIWSVESKNYPITLSLDGKTCPLCVDVKPLGSYTPKNHFTTGIVEEYGTCFELIKTENNKATLLCVAGINFARGCFDNVDDRISQYRTAIQDGTDIAFSNYMKSLLTNFSKVVHKTNTTTISYSSKFHLLSANEVGITSYDEEPILALGNETYPYLINSRNLEPFATRSRFKDPSGSGIYWSIAVGDANNSMSTYIGEEIGDNEHYRILHVLIQIASTTKVSFIETIKNVSFYKLDSNGTTTIANIPLGSIIVDYDGARS